MRFKTDWASLIVGSKFNVLALFNRYLRTLFQVQAPGGAYIWTEGFLRYQFGGLIFQLEGLIFGILRYQMLEVLSFCHRERV